MSKPLDLERIKKLCEAARRAKMLAELDRFYAKEVREYKEAGERP